MKKIKNLFCLIILILPHSSCESSSSVETGLDRIHEYANIFSGKRIGIITNHTAYNSKNEHISDKFFDLQNSGVVALFGPEHGIRGKEAAGLIIEDEKDPVKNIPVYSLYGKTKKPTPEMLEDIDILVFDIQDIGARFYTYIPADIHKNIEKAV